uniref:Uncharacterized protein n=1 Tax=Anguilla anguilla TaxID=7936 RepID=A0A0E9STZ2_ANGAN
MQNDIFTYPQDLLKRKYQTAKVLYAPIFCLFLLTYC